MYKFESEITDLKELKKLRSKMRKQRNKFANNILLHFSKKNEVEMKKEFILFEKFYKENYTINDYSITSMSSNNRDKETTILLETFLEVVKIIKTQIN